MYPIPLVLSSLTYDIDGTIHWTPMCIQYPHVLHVHLICFTVWNSLDPRPLPAFHHLQHEKVRRAWYLFSSEHDVIRKWRKFTKLWYGTLALLAVLGQEYPRTIKPTFYHSFYADLTLVRKDPRPSPALLYWKQRKAAGKEANAGWVEPSSVPCEKHHVYPTSYCPSYHTLTIYIFAT